MPSPLKFGQAIISNISVTQTEINALQPLCIHGNTQSYIHAYLKTNHKHIQGALLNDIYQKTRQLTSSLRRESILY